MLGAHERAGFNCGHERIDRYFHEAVSQDVKRRYAACYVLVDKASGKLAGFYTLSAHSIALNDITPALAKKLPRYPTVPAALIGWLGRDLSFRGQEVGSMLLYDAIARVATSPMGAHAICADAIDAAAEALYEAHQFERFTSRPGSFFLPVKTALALVALPAKPAPRERPTRPR